MHVQARPFLAVTWALCSLSLPSLYLIFFFSGAPGFQQSASEPQPNAVRSLNVSGISGDLWHPVSEWDQTYRPSLPQSSAHRHPPFACKFRGACGLPEGPATGLRQRASLHIPPTPPRPGSETLGLVRTGTSFGPSPWPLHPADLADLGWGGRVALEADQEPAGCLGRQDASPSPSSSLCPRSVQALCPSPCTSPNTFSLEMRFKKKATLRAHLCLLENASHSCCSLSSK